MQEPTLLKQEHGQPASAEVPARQEGTLASMPQALLGSGTFPLRYLVLAWPRDEKKHWQETFWLLLVQDENLKNIMMSWYYAGYYTGLHTGQQQVPNDAPLQQ
jgi:hypothetical protein